MGEFSERRVVPPKPRSRGLFDRRGALPATGQSAFFDEKANATRAGPSTCGHSTRAPVPRRSAGRARGGAPSRRGSRVGGGDARRGREGRSREGRNRPRHARARSTFVEWGCAERERGWEIGIRANGRDPVWIGKYVHFFQTKNTLSLMPKKRRDLSSARRGGATPPRGVNPETTVQERSTRSRFPSTNRVAAFGSRCHPVPRPRVRSHPRRVRARASPARYYRTRHARRTHPATLPRHNGLHVPLHEGRGRRE